MQSSPLSLLFVFFLFFFVFGKTSAMAESDSVFSHINFSNLNGYKENTALLTLYVITTLQLVPRTTKSTLCLSYRYTSYFYTFCFLFTPWHDFHLACPQLTSLPSKCHWENVSSVTLENVFSIPYLQILLCWFFLVSSHPWLAFLCPKYNLSAPQELFSCSSLSPALSSLFF